MISINNKWALVTGASRGIGYLAAKELAKHGCNLVLLARKAENCRKILEEVTAMGVEAYAVGCELSDLSTVEAVCREIDDRGTKLDIILNNAGVQIAYRADYLKTPASDYEESFKINTIAPMMICYHFLPGMLERGFGRILNTTSGIALDPQQAGYSASKAALDKVTIDLGSKLQGSNVLINLTDPGWCRTDLGGPYAPNAPEDALPGYVTGVFVNDGRSGRYLTSGRFSGLTLEEAVEKAESIPSPY